MSLKSKIEAVIYASEEPVTLQQLVGLLADEAGAELDDIASGQASLPLEGSGEADSASYRALDEQTSSREEGFAESHKTLQAADGEALDRSNPDEAVLSEPDSEPVDEPASPAAPDADAEKRRTRDRDRAIRDHVRYVVDQLIREYAEGDRGIEIREVASGFRMGTKPEYHDAVRGFVKSLKPALKLTLPALETLAVVAYKQPVTAAEISDIRGVDSAGVLGGLMARKLIATAGRKQVIGRPMLYKTTRDFLLRFGLKDVNELPSMEEFERMAGELVEQEDLPMDHADSLIEQANARGDAEHILQDEQANNANSLADDAPPVSIAAPNESDNQQATAESAAGGNHDDDTESSQHGSTQAETFHPAENGEHGRGDRTGGEDSPGEHNGDEG